MSQQSSDHGSLEPAKLSLRDRWQNRTYRPFHRRWNKTCTRATWWLMPLELVGIIAVLVIFGLAQPDLYRSQMWEIGFENKLNSNPNMILYAYANHQPLPDVPLIWSQTLTDFNVAISVLSLFVLLAKLIAFIMKWWFPIIAVFANVALTALYAVSVYGQVGPDYADDRYPAPAAWYFRQGCELAKRYNAYGNCQIAQASLGMTLYLLVLYLVSLGFACYAMWPNPNMDMDEDDDEVDEYMSKPTPAERAGTAVSEMRDMNWEMQGLKTPMTARSMAYTPRTQAFNTLDRQLPLRQQGHRYG